MISRRVFLGTLSGVGLGALAGCSGLLARPAQTPGFGDLFPLPRRSVDLPPGFTVRALSRVGTRMSDELFVPMRSSGIGVFENDDGTLLLLNSHDILSGTPSRSGPFGMQSHLLAGRDTSNIYDLGPPGDKPAYASVTMMVFEPQTRRVLRSGLLLSGLLRAARGARTSRGTWLVGEAEARSPDDRYAQPHGYVFELAPSEQPGLPKLLPALGRFAHAAIIEDPASGILYQTEARPDGLIYRFVPAEAGSLTHGHLQALALPDGARLAPGAGRMPVRWIDLDAADTGADDLRIRGAALGATPVGEMAGLCVQGDSLLVCQPSATAGALWRYQPGRERLAGTIEPVGLGEGSLPGVSDVAVAPWGDLLVVGTAADGHPTLFGLTVHGARYSVVRSVRPDGEIAAPVFSPDGGTMFISLPRDGQTLAIRGPWSVR